MALTEKARLRLEGKSFDKLYTDHQAVWQGLCTQARNIVKPLIAGGEPTVDDIKQIVQPLVELHERYTHFMGDNPRLTQRYWPSDFTDYVLHKVYKPTLTIPKP
jgi:hypothetical protein